MIYLRKIKHAIPEDPKLYHNPELFDLAVRKNHILPTENVLAPVKLKFLDKDFEKNETSRLYYPDRKCLRWASEILQKIVEPYILGENSDDMTFDEAIDVHMELSKSPGFPWNLKHQTKRKILEHYRDVCYEIVQRIKNGEDVESYWQTSPKVEILSREKIEVKGKQRTFMCCDIIMYIVGLMLYGKQNSALLAMAYSHDWSAVGISPFYGGWDDLAKNLLQGDPTRGIICFDISAMEASMTPEIFEIIYGIRNAYKYGSDKNMKKWYFKQLVFSLVINPRGWLGINIGVNPSGQLNTLMDNTLACILLLLYCLARQCKSKEELWTLYCKTHGKVMGDDSILQDTPQTRKIPQYAAEIGFKMTLESKEGGGIEDATFLNMGFRYVEHLGMYIFRPNFDKLLASILYYFKSKSWRLTLAKLYSIRVLCYPYRQYLTQIDDYIRYVLDKHDATLRGETNMDEKITYSQLKNLSLSPNQINFLIYGLEGFRSSVL